MAEESQLAAAPAAAHDPGDETVELQLTAAEQQWLARADEERTASDEPSYDHFICTRTSRIDRMGTVTFAVLVVAITALSGWRALMSEPAAPVAYIAPAVVTPAPVAAPAQTPPATVKVPNPFDAAETFEFPAETTPLEAQNAVADLLLQRARDRQEQGLLPRHIDGHRPHHAGVANPLNVFVTKLPRPSGGLDGTASLRAETLSPE